MIFNISLVVQPSSGQTLLPFNYHYPLSAAIHSIIRKSNPEFARFFHDVGYGEERFKLFTFSDIRIPFTAKADRMLLLAPTGTIRICFHAPVAAEHFLKGIFKDEHLIIRDEISQVAFKIREVENCSYRLPESIDDIVSVLVRPLSPLVVIGQRQAEDKHPQYFSPYEKCFLDRLIFSWLQKYKATSNCDDQDLLELQAKTKVDVLFLGEPVTERKTTIKDGTKQAHKIKGYTKFKLRLTAHRKLIELALNSGLGVKNSLGMGCIELIN